MSEIANTAAVAKKSHTKIFVITLSVLVLLLVYGVGFIVLPISTLATYHNKNCDSALALNRIYISLYPRFIRDESIFAPVKECEAYQQAALSEEKGMWREAYDAYQVYSTTYPNGLFTGEVHEHSGVVLLETVNDQIEQEKYEEAVANLNLIISSYSDTSVCEEAWTLFPSIYTSWGADLRETQDFEKAEQVLIEFKAWSQSNQKPESEAEAGSELVQTYVAWGENLQSQKQYEGALAKFNMAASAETQPQSDSTAQAKAGQRKVYVEWGNELLAQKEFSGAIEKFNLAVSKADGNNDDGARDALANGQIQWALDLSTTEDFQAALEHLQTAKGIALSEAMKKSLDTAFEDTYLAFSKSSGPQARRAMKEALKTVCEKQKAPDLLIFGLNKDSIRFGLYGVNEKLPENLAATTPGEMHYVVCITETKIIESRTRKNIVFKFAGGYLYTLVKQNRAQIIWNVILLKTDTIQNVGETALKGGTPPPFPEDNDSGGFFYGTPPLEKLSEWLQSVIQ